jgi:hypothetical protein
VAAGVSITTAMSDASFLAALGRKKASAGFSCSRRIRGREERTNLYSMFSESLPNMSHGFWYKAAD